jgi:hypothetical protein
VAKKIRKSLADFYDRELEPTYVKELNAAAMAYHLDATKPNERAYAKAMTMFEHTPGTGNYVMDTTNGTLRKVASGGDYTLARKRAVYAPRIWNFEFLRKNKGKFIEDMMERLKVDERDAERIYDSIMETQDKDVYQQGSISVGLGKSGHQKQRNLANMSNLVFRDYIMEDPGSVVPVYLKRTIMHTQYVDKFGPYQHNLTTGLLELKEGSEIATVAKELGKNSPEDMVHFVDAINGSMGRLHLKSRYEWFRPIGAVMRASATMLTMSTIMLMSFGDMAWQIAAGKDARERSAGFKALASELRKIASFDEASKLNKREKELRYTRLGMYVDSLHDFAIDAMSDVKSISGVEGKANALMSRFMRSTGIHAFTNFNRRVALSAAEAILDEAAQFVHDPQVSAKEKAAAQKRLERAGVTAEQWSRWRKAGQPSEQDLIDAGASPQAIEDVKAGTAAMKAFMDSRVAHVTQMDKTPWADHPIGRLAWMFKGFFYAVGNHLFQGIWDNAKEGNGGEALKQTMYFVGLGTAVSLLGLYAASLIKYALPAAVTGNPLPPQALMAMSPQDAVLSALGYQAGGAFGGEAYSNMLTSPGGPTQIANWMPSVSILERAAQNPIGYVDNALEAATLLYGASVLDKRAKSVYKGRN